MVEEQFFKLSDVEGSWLWSQNGPWYGIFTIEKNGEKYAGKLDDNYLGAYGDKVLDIEISGDQISLTRDGRFGIQYWQGTLRYINNKLNIVNGRWKKKDGDSGIFIAEHRNKKAIGIFSGQPSETTYIEGLWRWSQLGPWHGFFKLEKKGDEYIGKLDDVFEGINGDEITDVEISGDQIKFKRNGLNGVQYWEGTLKIEKKKIYIIDGRWKENKGHWSSFLAEKIPPQCL